VSAAHDRRPLHIAGDTAFQSFVVKFQDFIEAVKQVGGFWAVINEVPPGSVRRNGVVGA
jgi:hypothetical protein